MLPFRRLMWWWSLIYVPASFLHPGWIIEWAMLTSWFRLCNRCHEHVHTNTHRMDECPTIKFIWVTVCCVTGGLPVFALYSIQPGEIQALRAKGQSSILRIIWRRWWNTFNIPSVFQIKGQTLCTCKLSHSYNEWSFKGLHNSSIFLPVYF